MIAGLDRLITNDTKIETTVTDNALTAVVEGSARVLANLPTFSEVLVNKARVH